ncbi:MAG: hypothetical protein ACK5Q5_16360 [Planctomycetaceae bacterium]
MPHSPVEQDSLRISPWVSWFFILTFGPLIAFFLAGLCGFPANEETFQVILLVEICLMALAVVLLVMIQAIGPWMEQDREALAWRKLLTPPPGSLLEELSQQPHEWDRRLDGYLRSQWRDLAPNPLRASASPPVVVSAPPPVAAPAPVAVRPAPPVPATTAQAGTAVMSRPGRPAPPPAGNPNVRRPPPGQPPRR